MHVHSRLLIMHVAEAAETTTIKNTCKSCHIATYLSLILCLSSLKWRPLKNWGTVFNSAFFPTSAAAAGSYKLRILSQSVALTSFAFVLWESTAAFRSLSERMPRDNVIRTQMRLFVIPPCIRDAEGSCLSAQCTDSANLRCQSLSPNLQKSRRRLLICTTF